MLFASKIVNTGYSNKFVKVYKNPDEYEFQECVYEENMFIDGKEESERVVRGCIQNDGSTFIWTGEILHGVIKGGIQHFNDIFNEEKFECFVVAEECGLEYIKSYAVNYSKQCSCSE